jgi:hypothetical protein
MNNSIFWDMTLCSPLKVNRRFGGAFRLNLQCLRISQARNQREAGSKHSLALLRPWRWERHVPLKRRLFFNGLHGVISQRQNSSIVYSTGCPNFIYYSHYMLYMFTPTLYAFSQPLYHVCTDFAEHIWIDSSTTVSNSLHKVTKISDFSSTISIPSSNVNAIFSLLTFDFDRVRLAPAGSTPCKGPCLGLQILLPCKSGVGTPKAKGDNPDRKSWSPRLGVGAVGRLPTHHKNI